MNTLLVQGNALQIPLSSGSVHAVITSPPYWGLRSYATGSLKSYELGAEPLHDCAGWATGNNCGECYVCRMRAVFAEVGRVMRDDGTLWLNLGSSYVSSTSHRNQYSPSESAPACGISGKELQYCRAIDYVCSRLCDEHQADFLSHLRRSFDNAQRTTRDHEPQLMKAHDTARLDFYEAFPAALPPCVLASTILEFLRQLPGECSRCSNRAISLSGRRVLSGEPREYARMEYEPSKISCDNPGSALPFGQQLIHSLCNTIPSLVCCSCNHLRDNVEKHYTTLKPKDDAGIPWRVALALQADGWYLRSDIIWSKPNPMPESVTDRPTKAHEYLFLLSKSPRYFYDAYAVREPVKPDNITGITWDERRALGEEMRRGYSRNAPKMGTFEPNPNGRNRRSVWTISTCGYSGAHFATFPPALVEPCIKAGTSAGGVCSKCGAQYERVIERGYRAPAEEDVIAEMVAKGVPRQKANLYGNLTRDPRKYAENPDKFIGWRPTCTCDAAPVPAIVFDPFGGSGTTAMVAQQLGRRAIVTDLSAEYLQLARERTGQTALDEWTNGKQAGANLAGLPMFANME